jgi:hypothetical protein
MIEDMMICKFVAEQQILRLLESNSDPGILEHNCGQVALIASSPESQRKRSYKCGDALDEQFETVSAQKLRGFSGRQGSFTSCNSNIIELTSRLHGVSFLLLASH